MPASEPSAAASPAASFTVSIDGDVVVVSAVGELDVVASAQFATAIRAASAPRKPCEVDLSGVTYLGSSALSVVIAARRGYPVRVRRGNGRVDRLLELTSLTSLYAEVPVDG